MLNIKIIHPMWDDIQLCCWTSFNIANLGWIICDIYQVNLTNRFLVFNKLKIETLEWRRDISDVSLFIDFEQIKEAAIRGVL